MGHPTSELDFSNVVVLNGTSLLVKDIKGLKMTIPFTVRVTMERSSSSLKFVYGLKT